MQINPVQFQNANTFKAITKIRIPQGKGNPQKLMVTVDHEGDFLAFDWRQVVIETMEKGKSSLKKIFGDKKSVMSEEDAACVLEYVDNLAKVPDKPGRMGVLVDEFIRQSRFE